MKLTPKHYHAALVMLAQTFAVGNEDAENGAHELAHALLCGVRQSRVETAINRMRDADADHHEVAVLALQLAGMRRLGLRCSARTSVAVSFEQRRSAMFATPGAMERAVITHRPNQRALKRFVAAVTSLAHILARFV